jgi:hypothetical protein
MKHPYLIYRYEFDDETGATKSSPAFTVYADSGEKATMIASALYPDLYLGIGHTTWRRYFRKQAQGVPCLNPEIGGLP